MREEYVCLSPTGVCAVFIAGFLCGEALGAGQAMPNVAFALLVLTAVRSDAMERLNAGVYRRRWFVWRRIGDVD